MFLALWRTLLPISIKVCCLSNGGKVVEKMENIFKRSLSCFAVKFAVKAVDCVRDRSLKGLPERIEDAKEKDVQHNGDCAAGFPGWLIAISLLASKAGRTGVGKDNRYL